ncbi:MAG: NAD-dependent epimerase/dehydratase family protein [Bacteroidales bacterium]|nr:NAD-dependent epimerase/dehydratase family protein [Bacteroidales bacterium]
MNDYQQNDKIEKGPSVLITGGSGLIGRYLTSALLAEGYQVSHLSRQTNSFGKVRVFRWDPAKEYINPDVFEGIDYIVHLSGANIGEKRWSVSRKKEIISSRVDSANLLFRTVSENNLKLKAFISASAIGYYGSVTSNKSSLKMICPVTIFLEQHAGCGKRQLSNSKKKGSGLYASEQP